MTRTKRKTGGDGRGKIEMKSRRKEGKRKKEEKYFQWQSSRGKKQGLLFSLEVEPYLRKLGSAETT